MGSVLDGKVAVLICCTGPPAHLTLKRQLVLRRRPARDGTGPLGLRSRRLDALGRNCIRPPGEGSTSWGARCHSAKPAQGQTAQGQTASRHTSSGEDVEVGAAPQQLLTDRIDDRAGGHGQPDLRRDRAAVGEQLGADGTGYRKDQPFVSVPDGVVPPIAFAVPVFHP